MSAVLAKGGESIATVAKGGDPTMVRESDAEASPGAWASDEGKASSPVSVLDEEEASNGSGDLLITEEMAAEEERLQEQRAKAEEAALEEARKEPPPANALFNMKLQKLLEKARTYSEFLYKNMNSDLEMAAEAAAKMEEEESTAGRGRGKKRKAATKSKAASKRKATAPANSEASKAAVAAAEQAAAGTSEGLSEEEICRREQARLCPKLTGGTLKGYQLKGIKWLISLWQNGLNGILADQMGLGKTVQTIGLLAHLMSQGMVGPFLIVAPLSTVSNWINELNRWMPGVPVLLYHGSKEQRVRLRLAEMPHEVTHGFPIIVTSFEIAMIDRRWLQQYKYKYIVVDEGHRLKNSDCKLIRELRLLERDNALLLTGTPLQNNLTELWSLLNFILPNVFTSAAEFTSWFDLEGAKQTEPGVDQESEERERRAQLLSMLHQILRPFLLRRLKEDVERNIPPKKEITLYAQMSAQQRGFNEHLVKRTLEEYLQATSDAPTMSRSRLNNVLMQLRKNCNHPDLLSSQFENSLNYPPVEVLLTQCGKLKLLDRLLTRLRTRGHKVLIFSQMTRMLDILEYFLQERGHKPFRIDGSMKQEDRRDQIKDFQTDPEASFVFLLSTRAGGLGINLTAADTVVIYDSDWNPHMDMQAMDRCHRIGQSKPVHVYRLATAHSVEGKMLKVAAGKLQLEHLVIEKGEFCKHDRDPNAAKPNKLEEKDIVTLLHPEQNDEENFVQSAEISEENMERLLDRSDLVVPSDKPAPPAALPPRGPGWEVVASGGGRGSLLSSIT